MTKSSEATAVQPLSNARTDHECFGCGERNPIGLHLRFSASDGGVEAIFRPGSEHQGFDDVVHGGIISTVLDEAMAWAAAAQGIWALTGDLRVRFRYPLNVGDSALVSARVIETRGRIVIAEAELVRDYNRLRIATARSTLVRVNPDQEAIWRTRYLQIFGGLNAE